MKYLIYELFSGVGLCNQLFSLETAIYLACIMKRKLILLIKNPLCHCGRASWDYGYILNFFTDDFQQFLPYGFDVFYRALPNNFTNATSNNEYHYKTEKFSSIVFVDHSLDLPENQEKINVFCHHRTKHILNLNDITREYVYINTSNASRCFYNFYTTEQNYKLMYDICTSLKFKPIFYEVANKLYSELPRRNNNLFIFFHLRFGDYHKDSSFLNRSNDIIINNFKNYVEGHRTNLIKPDIYLLIDNKNNQKFNSVIQEYNVKYVDKSTQNAFQNFVKSNTMIYHDIHNVIKYDVMNAIIEMILASKADQFVGYSSSTFSHYIQYLRFVNNKPYYNYVNLQYPNHKYCRLMEVTKSDIEWKRLGYSGGHPVSWHYFFAPFLRDATINFTIEGKTDGFGSQLQACFSMVAFCMYRGFNYVHTPFQRMHHNDEKLPNFPSIMNDFINLEHEFKTRAQLSNFESSRLFKAKEGYFVHGSIHPEFFYTSEVLDKLRNCYYSKSKPNISDIYLKDKYNVAVHVRRGDVSSTTHSSRYTDNKLYIHILKNNNLPSNTQIHLFSEGEPSDFKEFTGTFPDIKLHLNANIQLTFHCMVSADLLIASKSSFCYTAALLNNNKVDGTLIKSWWHKPLRKWVL